MRSCRFAQLSIFILFLVLISISAYAQGPLQFVSATPCRVVDTRNPDGPFGGPSIQGGAFRSFTLPGSPSCNIPSSAVAYSVNVTVVPQGPLGYLTVWPTGQTQPVVSTTNSLEGLIKANAAIVPAGTSGAISVFASNTTDVVLDIDGYFIPATDSALAFYPVTPCRVADTRNGQPLTGGVPRNFSIQGVCGVPTAAEAYSLNFTAVPHGNPLGYLTVWPAGETQPVVSTLNAPTGTTTANAAIVPGGTSGKISAFASNTTDLVIDINGYFAPPGSSGELSLYTLPPCRVLDTRSTRGQFTGELTVDVVGSACNVPAGAGAYVLNATVVPPGALGYLTLWPNGGTQPVVSTLNALDGQVTSNMAIVPTTNGSIDAFASNPTQLVVDIFSYLAPLPTLTVTTTTLPNGQVGMAYPSNTKLAAAGGVPPYTWSIVQGSGTLPPGLSLNSGSGLISGTPTSAGVYNFTVQVTDSESTSATAPLSITILPAPLTITTTVLPSGQVTVQYAATLGAIGGVPPYTWSIVQGSGTLPPGLSLNSSSGLISGTPTAAGVYNFTVQVTDQANDMATMPLQIVINAATTNGALSGDYAFSFNGFNNGQPIFMAGNLIADGNGHITAGVFDLNSGSGTPQHGTAFTGTYMITANGLGTMTFNVSGTLLNFSVSVSNGGNGQMIENNSDPSTRGSGVFFVQTVNDFDVPPAGNYAIGTLGADQNFNRYAKGGAFQVISGGDVNNGGEDVNDNGTLSNRAFSGTFDPPDPRSGRGQASLTFPNGVTNNYAYYVVSSAQFIMVGTDPVSDNDPLTLASIVTQGGNLNNGSLSGVSALELSALQPNNGSPEADVILGLITANGSGSASTSLDENRGGTLIQQQVSQGSYSVASNGRVVLSGFGGTPPILYLSSPNQAFAVGQDASVQSGIVEPQLGPPPYNNLSIFGTYLGGSITPVLSPIVDAVNYVLADGNGNLTGFQNYSAPSGSNSQNLMATYQVDSTGRAVLSGTPAGIMYVISNKKVVLLPSGNNPALSTFFLGLTE